MTVTSELSVDAAPAHLPAPVAESANPSRGSPRKRRFGKAKGLAAAGLLALGVGVGVGESKVEASAYSCTGYGVGLWYGRTAQFCADTKGSGLHVDTIGAGYASPIGWAGLLCNTRVQAEFVDSRGTVYAKYVSSQQNGCSTVGAWKWNVNGNARPGNGTLRYTLLSNGATIAVVEHTIKP